MSENYKYILKILNHLGRTFEDFKEISIEKTKDCLTTPYGISVIINSLWSFSSFLLSSSSCHLLLLCRGLPMDRYGCRVVSHLRDTACKSENIIIIGSRDLKVYPLSIVHFTCCGAGKTNIV